MRSVREATEVLELRETVIDATGSPASETTTDNSEPAVQPGKPEPYLQELIASTIGFGLFLTLARLAFDRGWMLGWKLSSDLTGLAVFAAVAYGLTIIITFSAISWPFRKLAEAIPVIGPHLYSSEPEPHGLLACALCTGTWVGGLLAVLGVSAYPVTNWFDIVIHGWLGAGVCWVLYSITHKLGTH